MKRFDFILTVLFIGTLTLIGTVTAAQQITISDVVMDEGGTGTCTIVLDSAPTGLAGFNMTLAILDPLVSDNITFISYNPKFNMFNTQGSTWADIVWDNDINTLPLGGFSSGYIKASTTSSTSFPNGSTNIVLATLTLHGGSAGTTLLDGTLKKMSDNTGGNYTSTTTVIDGTITVNSDNTPPDAVDDTGITTDEDTPVVITVLFNDNDPDGDTLSVTAVSAPGHGTAVINADNTVTYTPAATYHGDDTFTYTISDGNGGTDTATVSVTVTSVNNAPDAADDEATTAEDTAVTIPVLANDTDDDGDTLSVTSTSIPGHGSATINADKTITYTPAANYHGSDTFTYTISDGNGGTDTATVSVTITSVNDVPDAADDEATTAEDTAVTIPVLTNDTDADDDDILSVTSTSIPGHGSATINADKTVTYTPAATYHGDDTFTYTISDGNGGTDTATVSVTVTSVNNAPDAADDEATTAEDTAVTIPVLANDTDDDGDTLSVTSTSIPGHGSATINADKTITYTPAANYHGSDTFTYTISDGNGGTDTATVSVTITSVNDVPDAADDEATTAEDTAVTIPVLTNDTDADDDDILSVTSTSIPGHGSATINADKTVTYTPAATYHGDDTFTYTISDGNGGTDTATVTITVTDTTPPGQVTGLVNTTYLYNSITWIWTDPEDADLAYVKLYLDGVYQTTVPAGIETYTSSGLQPDTEYTLGITTVDTSGNENTDMVTYSARTAYEPTLGDAVDSTGLAWTTGGGANWFPQTATSYNDGDAAQSGVIGNSQSTYLQTTVTGPGTLTFWWKVSSQTRDYLRFYVDGTLQASIQGEVAWQQKTYSITEGQHTLKWEYAKDRLATAGSDCGWVDWVVFTPAGDTTPPGPVTGLANTTYEQTSITWTWTDPADLDLDYVNVFLGGAPVGIVQDGVQTYTATGLSPNTEYTLGITTVDTSGNENTAMVTDSATTAPTLDTTPPGPVTGLANTTYEQTSITWTWTDPADADFDYVNVFLGGSPVGIVQDGIQTYTATGLLPNTEYTLGITTVDTSGNDNTAAVTDSATTAPTLDTTPPGPVTGLANTTYEQTSITWTWTDPADADFDYVNVFLGGAPVGIVQDGVQTYTATGLSPNTEYTLGITTVDTSGNENTAMVTDSATTAPSSGTLTLGEAVDNTGLAWTTGGSANWFPQTATSYNDGDAAQSGVIGNSQSTYLQTTVTGPGTLTFWWKVSSQTRDYLRFYVDGTLQASIQGEVAWQQKTYSLTEGTHTLKWEYAKDRLATAGSDCGWVDWVVFTPAGDTTPPGPVTGLVNTTYEQTSITWTWADPTDADFDYVNVFLDGSPVGIVQDGVQSYTATGLTPATAYTLGVTTVDTSGNENTAMVTDSATTAPTLDTTPPGPVTGLANTTYEQTSITWTWADPTDADLDYVNVFLDGAPVGIVQDGVQTYTATGLTPAMAYTLGITTVDTSGNENAAMVTDSATTAPSSGILTLGDAVDSTGLAWTTGGGANWFPQTATSYNDGDAAQSGVIGNSQSTYLQTTVTGPGTLTFWWKVSSQTRDPLRFSIDGTLRNSIQGEVAWQQKTYSINEGTHVLKWEYVKDRAYSAGSDAGWVDKVTFSSPSSPLYTEVTRSSHTALPLQIIRSFVTRSHWSGQFPA